MNSGARASAVDAGGLKLKITDSPQPGFPVLRNELGSFRSAAVAASLEIETC